MKFAFYIHCGYGKIGKSHQHNQNNNNNKNKNAPQRHTQTCGVTQAKDIKHMNVFTIILYDG